MADINLLSNNHPQKAPEGGAVPHSLNYIGAVIFIVVVILCGGAWYFSAHALTQEQNVQSQTQQVQQSVISMPNYSAFISQQDSLQGLSFLIQNHTDWSQPTNQIAGITLKSVSYTSITINQDGTGTFEGLVPSYAELDKYLNALNTATLSPFIATATLKSVSAASSSNNGSGVVTGTPPTSVAAGLSFTIDVTFKKNLWTSATTTPQ